MGRQHMEPPHTHTDRMSRTYEFLQILETCNVELFELVHEIAHRQHSDGVFLTRAEIRSRNDNRQMPEPAFFKHVQAFVQGELRLDDVQRMP